MKKRRKERSLDEGRLAQKREAVRAWLKGQGVDVTKIVEHVDVLAAGYRACGHSFNLRNRSVNAVYAHYGNVLQWAGHGKVGEVRQRAGKPQTNLSEGTIKAFYRSYEWRKLRYQALERDGGACLACGRGRKDGAVLHVDHIKPLRRNWELRLDLSNLQVLCDLCNHGKGNWNETDWRDAEATDNVVS